MTAQNEAPRTPKEIVEALALDPDFRRDAPTSGPFCVRCQKPILDPGKAVRVTVDWNKWTVTRGGNELMGANCWRAIRRTALKSLEEATR